jgi:hypothetical protein
LKLKYGFTVSRFPFKFNSDHYVLGLVFGVVLVVALIVLAGFMP